MFLQPYQESKKMQSRIAVAGISVNPVSTFYHDPLFVPLDKAEKAMKILRGFSDN